MADWSRFDYERDPKYREMKFLRKRYVCCLINSRWKPRLLSELENLQTVHESLRKGTEIPENIITKINQTSDGNFESWQERWTPGNAVCGGAISTEEGYRVSLYIPGVIEKIPPPWLPPRYLMAEGFRFAVLTIWICGLAWILLRRSMPPVEVKGFSVIVPPEGAAFCVHCDGKVSRKSLINARTEDFLVWDKASPSGPVPLNPDGSHLDWAREIMDAQWRALGFRNSMFNEFRKNVVNWQKNYVDPFLRAAESLGGGSKAGETEQSPPLGQ
ncbi:MAG: hypothetical protein N3A38_11065 [Planctomycetota bacterium]|nr:hypothetical protein [Planctomycetota bacterium]